MALNCLNSMITDEPIRTTIRSILRIKEAVEHAISSERVDALAQGSHSTLSPLGPIDQSLPSIQFPSLDRNVAGSATDLILFTERNSSSETAHQSNDIGLTSGVDSLYSSFWTSNYDILTTDLFNFFPTDNV